MRVLSFLVFMTVASVSFAQTDEDAIKAVINSAYVGGIHNNGPMTDVRKGFHPSFVMFVKNNNDLKATTLEEWLANIEKSRTAGATAQPIPAVAKYRSVLVNGNSAAVTLDLHRGDKKVFTDNLLLYKFDEGWRIIAKNFFRYQ